MTLNELDTYFRTFLRPEDFPSDPSRNGIQVENSAPAEKQITKIAFAVDACEQSALEASAAGAQLLFVHHGMFWGDCEPVIGSVYRRYCAFIKNNLALYACHIPLDANNPYGNNYGLAARLNLKNCSPFGEWRGMSIGVKGELDSPVTAEELASRVLLPGETPAGIFAFGKQMIRSVGIISGGAGDDFIQAHKAGLDAFITGEVQHELYHPIKEAGINVIAGGHYQTETVGINLVREKVERELKIETVFIDIPTGL